MEQLSIIENIQTSTEQSARETFACCSRYRECSDANKCLIPEKDYSINCTYRKNLENGNIFFGKSANGFDINTYNEIINKYNHLSEQSKYDLNCILIHHRKYSGNILVYQTSSIEELINKGFISSISMKSYKKTLLLSLEYRFLKTFINNECSEKSKLKKEDIITYLLSNDIPELNEYINKFNYISIPAKMIMYMHELYHDFLRGKDDEFKIKLPKYNEPNFLKSEMK